MDCTYRSKIRTCITILYSQNYLYNRNILKVGLLCHKPTKSVPPRPGTYQSQLLKQLLNAIHKVGFEKLLIESVIGTVIADT